MNPNQIILDAFRGNTFAPGTLDIQHTPLYDTVTIAAGGSLSTLTSALFTNVGPSSSKTLAQTNMTQGNRLPAPEAFSIFSIRCRWSETVLLADAITLLNGFALQLVLGNKVYNLAPIWHYNAGGGLTGFLTTATTAFYSNGTPSREAMHKLALPIVIENQSPFSASLQGSTVTLTAGGSGGTGLTFVCLLDGLYARGVQ